MVFWLGILVGGLFVWFTIKMMGFYETWAMLFNIVVSIYLGIFLRPVIADAIPAAGNTPYSNAMTVVATAIAFFAILHGISFVFFTSQFSVSFPKVLDVLGTGFLGFLTGLLVWSFAALLICITPISQNEFVKSMDFKNQVEQANIPYVYWFCYLVNDIVSSSDDEVCCEEMVAELLKSVEEKPRPRTIAPADSNEPADINPPNEM